MSSEEHHPHKLEMITMTADTANTALTVNLRLELLRLARMEDDLAAAEAAAIPYWSPCPVTVHGHRMAAAALRADADALPIAS
jgi:hypothetical protein